MIDIFSLSVGEIASKIKDGQLTSVEVFVFTSLIMGLMVLSSIPFFAMLIALNLQTSFLTPPMAMSAYYLKGVQKANVELLEIFKGIMPFLGIVIFGMFLMYMFPGIALWLPDVLFAD